MKRIQISAGLTKSDTKTDWGIRGRELVNFNCEAVIVFQIDAGHSGDVKLDNLRVAAVNHWRKAIHEGNGLMQLIIDPAAGKAYRTAIENIMTGKDTDEMATMWFV
jgi:hypothetical protein